MNCIRRLLLTSGTSLLLVAGICLATVPANAAVTPAAPLQEEMQYLTASQLAEEEHLMAVLWIQRSAEYRALSYQAYNLATMEVDKAIEQRRKEEKKKLSEQKRSLRPLAVVLDIDDTIVSNAPMQVHYLEHPEARANFNAWEQWILQQNELIPGAGDFLKHADKHGVQIFYVTARGPQDQEATIRFVQKAGLPFPDATHLRMNDRSGSKMKNFARLARRYDIICYLGDNAGDFPIGAVREDNEIIYKKEACEIKSGSETTKSSDTEAKHKFIREKNETAAAPGTELQTGKDKTKMMLDIAAMLKHDKNAKRNRIVDGYKRDFGTKFILLPNPLYGDWENNLAKNYRKLPSAQHIALRKAALKSPPVTAGKKT